MLAIPDAEVVLPNNLPARSLKGFDGFLAGDVGQPAHLATPSRRQVAVRGFEAEQKSLFGLQPTARQQWLL